MTFPLFTLSLRTERDFYVHDFSFCSHFLYEQREEDLEIERKLLSGDEDGLEVSFRISVYQQVSRTGLKGAIAI